MVFFPNCKINLGLHITGKRQDGFHNLETIFYPLPLVDIGEIIEAKQSDNTHLHISGIPISGNEEENICIKAYQLLKKNFPTLPHLDIYLHKLIPIGAGLGGGSADGVYILKAINEKYKLNISQEKLSDYALLLGSDCPFFVVNKPAFATQRGEILEEIDMNLSGKYLVIVNPGIHINTGWAFQQIDINEQKSDFISIVQNPISEWKNILYNDFEIPVFKSHPEIKNIKNTLYNIGAIYASMSGTGSTVYGIFEKKISVTAHFPEHYFIKNIAI